MIEKLILKNWESHVDTTIEFSKYTTILTGNSDAGKSGIFRAFRFVLLNEGEGEKNINYGATETTVELHCNNHIIKRIRDRQAKNEYWLDDKVFKAFGQTVPTEIQEAIGLEDINYEWQFDSRPYLINQSGGYIAQTMNEIVNLSLIDTSLKTVNSLKREKNKEIVESDKDITDYVQQIKDLNWIEEAEKTLLVCKKMDKNINDYKISVEKFSKVILDYNNLTNAINNISFIEVDELNLLELHIANTISTNKKIDTFVNLIESITTLTKNYNNLKNIDENLVELFGKQLNIWNVQKANLNIMKLTQDSYVQLNNSINAVKVVNERVLKRAVTHCSELNDRLQQLGLYSTLANDSSTLEVKLDDVNELMLKLKIEYEEIAPDFCPFCNQKLSKDLNKLNI